MVLVVAYNNTTTHITGVTDSLGALTWSLESKVVNTTSGAATTTVEVWTAPASAVYNSGLTSAIQTPAWSGGNPDSWTTAFCAVLSCFSISSPFDNNVSLPASNFNTSSAVPPTVTFSTSQADDLIVAFTTRANTFGASTPAGWTNEGNGGGNGGANGSFVTIDYKSVSTTQSSATYAESSATTDKSWTTLVLAFTADSSAGPPSGTWHSTEGTDTFSGHGGLLGGTWSSTEAKDSASMAGFVPINGTWAVTGTKDTMSSSGYPELIGSWASIDIKDHFLFGLRSPLIPQNISGRRRVLIIT